MGNTDQAPQAPMTELHTEATPENERTTYQAQCHCGTVKFTVTLEFPFPKYKVNKCNCSICVQQGYLLVYPKREDVVFEQGYETMKDYQFNTKKKLHRFCPNCGGSVLIDFQVPKWKKDAGPEKDVLGVNARNFIGFDPDDTEFVAYETFDGRRLL